MENKIKKAFEFAQAKHYVQVRKGSELPYMIHIYDVARTLINNHCKESTIIAGILHDTLEDTQTTPAEIENLFGKEVLEIVLAETENKELKWKDRRQIKIDEIKTASLETKKVKCADMLSNLSDVKRDLISNGNVVWQKFNAGKELTKWYYQSMINNMSQLNGLLMYENLKRVFDSVFKEDDTTIIV